LSEIISILFDEDTPLQYISQVATSVYMYTPTTCHYIERDVKQKY